MLPNSECKDIMLPRECKEWSANVMHDLKFGQLVRYGAAYAPKYVKSIFHTLKAKISRKSLMNLVKILGEKKNSILLTAKEKIKNS